MQGKIIALSIKDCYHLCKSLNNPKEMTDRNYRKVETNQPLPMQRTHVYKRR